jgi:hypothetical protein
MLAMPLSQGTASGDQYSDDTWGQCSGTCNGNMTERPDLRLIRDRVYWASYADFSKGHLSIDYHVRNLGPGTLYRVEIFKAEATKGVKKKTSDLPRLACALPANETAAFTLVYKVPPGVTNFGTTTFAKAKNSCSGELMYPAQPGQN